MKPLLYFKKVLYSVRKYDCIPKFNIHVHILLWPPTTHISSTPYSPSVHTRTRKPCACILMPKKSYRSLGSQTSYFPHISLLGFFECSQASRDGTGGKQSPFLKFRKNVIAFTSLKKPPSREFVAFNSNLSNLLEVVPVAFPFLEKFVSSRKMNRKKLMKRHFSKIIEFGIGKKDLLYMLVAELCRRILHYI